MQYSDAHGRALHVNRCRDPDEAARRRVADRVISELAALREHTAAWADYLVESESTHVDDGIR